MNPDRIMTGIRVTAITLLLILGAVYPTPATGPWGRDYVFEIVLYFTISLPLI